MQQCDQFLRLIQIKRSVAYAGFLKGGARKFRKFENNKDQYENFPTQNQFRFPAQNWVKTKKKKVLLSSVFGPKLGESQKKSLRPPFLCSNPLPKLQNGGIMLQFCILFYSNYAILATQRGGGHGPMLLPKYAPASDYQEFD